MYGLINLGVHAFVRGKYTIDAIYYRVIWEAFFHELKKIHNIILCFIYKRSCVRNKICIENSVYYTYIIYFLLNCNNPYLSNITIMLSIWFFT